MAPHYCIECGMALVGGARFCGQCGREAVDPAQAATQPSAPVTNIRICPQCGQTDKVEKVSGIVATQSRQEKNEWLDSDSNRRFRAVVTRTQLASQLTLSEPYERGPFLVKHGWLLAVGFIGMLFLYYGLGDFFSGNHLVGLLLCIPAALVVVAVVSLKVRDRGKVEVEAQRWSERKPGWDKLYYCYREDVVFSDGRCAPASRMLEFLDGKQESE